MIETTCHDSKLPLKPNLQQVEKVTVPFSRVDGSLWATATWLAW